MPCSSNSEFPILQMLRGENPGRMFELTAEITLIGRLPECDIWLGDAKVSKRHARIQRKGEEYFLEDLGSHNHTYLEGKLLIPNTPVKLNDGDCVEICDLHFVFRSSLVTVEDDAQGEDSSTILGMLDVGDAAESHQPPIASGEDVRRALFEIGRNLSRTTELNDILEKTLETLFTIFPQADRGFILFREERDQKPLPSAVRCRDGSRVQMTISRTVFDHVMNERKAILSTDAGIDPRFKQAQSIIASNIRTMMCVPLMDLARKSIGMIQIDTCDQKANFNARDLDLMIAIAGQVELAIENNRLHEVERRRKSLEMEMQGARRVQLALLPRETPPIPGYAFWHFYEPALTVGGDYYDFVPLGLPGTSIGRWAVSLGDVAGKGMPAALMMTKLSADARMALLLEAEPQRVMQRLNQRLCEARLPDRFVTFLLVLIDSEQHTMTVVNAGHMGPMLRRANGSVQVIGQPQAGLMLGIDTTLTYNPVTVSIEPGDVVLLYTDGVSEAMNPRNRMFTSKRLAEALAASQPPVDAIGPSLLQAVRAHAAGTPQSDDIAMICFGRLPEDPGRTIDL